MKQLNQIVLGLSLFAAPLLALAHGDGDHSHDEEKPAANVALNKPQRLPDGRVFVPKATQFQLGVTTQLTEMTAANKTIELNGHVVMDPNRGARIQASSAGRISAPPTGLPLLGSRVKKGQILAWIQPAQGGYEAAQQQAELAEVQSNQAQAVKTLTRLRELEGSVPRKEIEAAESQLAALRARSQALSSARSGEALRSPLDGVLSASNLVNGQLVDPSTVLFEIVDPRGLLIEALAYDAALLTQIDKAAINGNPLRYLGGASALRDGALPLLFAPSQPMPLALGQAVKVVASTQVSTQGVILPASALVKNGSNQTIVWVLEQAQHLRAVPVQAMPLDGKRHLVTQLKAGQRVVVQGANLINQIR